MQILLVEDSEEVSCITVEFLRELGHEVVAVETAEIAMDELKRQSFDAVMTDIRTNQAVSDSARGHRIRLRRSQRGVPTGRKDAYRATAAQALRLACAAAHSERSCRDLPTDLSPTAIGILDNIKAPRPECH
jgi:CheY-like chemotaxis protein